MKRLMEETLKDEQIFKSNLFQSLEAMTECALSPIREKIKL